MTAPRHTQGRRSTTAATVLDARILSYRYALLNSAAVVIIALSLWASAALGQDTRTLGTDQTQQSQQSGGAGGASGEQQGQGQGTASDTLIATVGDAEVRSSDLQRAIGTLPPQLGSQSPAMVISMALQQLVLREAIVQEARSQGLAEDPEVQSLVDGATQTAKEDALVQVWLQRELANRVTPEAVDQAHAGLQAVARNQPVPPLEQLRPQIEQNLAQQTVEDIRGSLLSNAQITVHGPDRQPTDQQQSGGGQANTNGQDEGATSNQAAAQTQQVAGADQTTLMVAGSQEYDQYLVDREGRAVYGFTADEQGQGDTTEAVSNCYDACAEAWPPVLVDAMPTTGEMAKNKLLGATLRADGSMQLTYDGWPLYHFVQDQGPGQATGQDVQAHGGEWYLLRPTGEMVEHE